jgi:hypothetical protein
MFLFLKQIPAAERLIKRNPFFYSEFREALERMEDADAADAARHGGKAARADRALGRRDAGYRDYNFARPFREWPLLSKARLQNEAGISSARPGFPGRGGDQWDHRPAAAFEAVDPISGN